MRCASPNRFVPFTIAIFLALACASPAFPQQPPATLPIVTSTATPDYPPSAENARIDGAVRVRVYTNQGKVLWLQVQDGPPLLHQAASDYIRTWQFQQKEQMSFLVTLNYRIEEVKICGPLTIVAEPHFPTEVDIIARDTKSCDILSTVLALNKPVTINFSVELNGEPIAPPGQVALSVDGHPLNLPVQNGQFIVPLDVVRAKSVGFSLSLPLQQISTTVDGSDFASENWTLRLADKAFGEDFQFDIPKAVKTKFACFLTFDSHYSSAGAFKFDPHCRTIEKPHK
ncbi:MAG TPA: energy transducer TonB [Candidatus Acidoferrales bacterium]|nr:energy transducer TonB [Candidatus Acidoferrales bacterium]